jgi:hypothetical protein
MVRGTVAKALADLMATGDLVNRRTRRVTACPNGSSERGHRVCSSDGRVKTYVEHVCDIVPDLDREVIEISHSIRIF